MFTLGNDLAGDTIHLLTCLEYHPNGNLQEYLERKKDSLEIHEGFLLATSFLDGLYYLHKSVKTGSSQKPGKFMCFIKLIFEPPTYQQVSHIETLSHRIFLSSLISQAV